ncbi:hypothetical protein AB1Y20_014869 [Prymnesium parvum]|uniref:Macrocin O-methyltransferase n=1 Tax=Prymnesium parvum TaxID=97485 RepID=A0AB34JZR2_PRYPA
MHLWLLWLCHAHAQPPTRSPAVDRAAAHWRQCRGKTMVPYYNAMMAYKAVEYLNQHRIPGDIVEAGVWAGGMSCLMAHAQMATQTLPRRIWLFDTFEGMPEPTAEDDRRSRRLWKAVRNGSTRVPGAVRERKWAYAPLPEVRAVLVGTGYPDLSFVQGKVEATLLDSAIQLPSTIALLRLDTDWYKSTQVELNVLWPRLSPGGWMYVDDYSAFGGARRAVDEWLKAHGWARAARKAKAVKKTARRPTGPSDDSVGCFSVIKARPFNASAPFDASNETLRALCPACSGAV